uniref:Odorant receptor n=1 Tax=Eucryptorrhynchus brandti TaxID=436910 RepID=A0A8F4MY68_EUCBR|nr:odorant receptor 12 [Eucryptorrhynchus brandti]
MGLFDTPRAFLQIWGIWPVETIDTDLKKNMYMAYRAFQIGWYTLFNISQTIGCIGLILHGEPFERISKCLSVLVTLVLMLWKGIIYLRNKIPQMCLMVIEAEKALIKLEDQEIRATYNHMEKNNRYMNIWIIGSSVFTLIAFIVVSFIELFTIGPDFWEYDNISFMHELYLPFKKRDHYYFIIFANIFTAVVSVVLNAAIQTTFFGLIAYASIRLRVIQIGLEKLYAGPKTVKDTERILKGFLQEHQDSIRFIEELNEATKNVLLMSFLLNSIKVAAVLFQIMAVRKLAVLAFPIFYSFMLISEVFCLGWMCNEVKDQSLAIADAAYNTLWYNESKSVKLMLQIMIMRAQKPLTMTIGPFSPMSTDTIVTTLKAAYSYTTVMMDH